jgi:hypothetical protein
VHTFVLRVALPDRPGALGAVASRIGSVRGDVVAVEIVERTGGRAVDEFVVQLSDEALLPLLLSEMTEVDGVLVEEAHPISGGIRDRRLDAYDTAAVIVAQRNPTDVLASLASRTRQELDALWSCVVDVEQSMLVASEGSAPAAAWVAGYVQARRRGDPLAEGDDDDDQIHWVDLAAWDLVLVVGRPGWRLGTREHDRMAALARLADERWIDVSEHRDAAGSRAADASPARQRRESGSPTGLG